MRKHALLIATAIAALTVGSSTAFAQGAREGEPHGAAPAARSAPAEKIAPSAPANRMGQAPAAQPNRMGPSSPQQHMNRETTGQAPSEQRAAPRKDNERAVTPNRSNERATRPNRETTGQAPSEQRAAPRKDNERAVTPNRSNERATRPNRETTGQGTMEQRSGAPQNRSGATDNRSGATENRGSARAAVNLSSEQRTRIHSIIVGERGAPRVGRVDFDVKVGVAVPRTIRLAPIPETIVTIEPEWRGFEYFLVGDKIVVVDPATLEIVAILPA